MEWQHRRNEIDKQIGHTGGVKEVSSLITLKTKATSDTVKNDIEKALIQIAELEAEKLNVTVSGSGIRLEGYDFAFHKQRPTESAAWHSAGVNEMIDQIRVD